MSFTDTMLGGMRRGFDHRLLPPYRVSRDEEVDLDSSTGDSGAVPKRSSTTEDLEQGVEAPPTITSRCRHVPSAPIGGTDIELAPVPTAGD